MVATVSGLPSFLMASSAHRTTVEPRAREGVRQAAVMTLFSLHTIRFEIYLRPTKAGARSPPETDLEHLRATPAGLTGPHPSTMSSLPPRMSRVSARTRDSQRPNRRGRKFRSQASPPCS
jgi:hypothetical protein